MQKVLILLYFKFLRKLTTPAKILQAAFRRHQANNFLIQPQDNIKFTYKDTKKRYEKLFCFLRDKGLKRQDLVVFYSENCFEYFEIRAAANLGNFIFFAVPKHLDVDSLMYYINKSEAKILFFRGIKKPELIKAKTTAIHCIDLDSPGYKKIFEAGDKKYRTTYNLSFISTYNLSSGTTQNIPKIVSLANINWVSSLYNYILNSDKKPNKKLVFYSPISLATAASTSFLPLILSGATNVISKEGFSFEELTENIKKYNINTIYFTPSWFIEFFEGCKENNQKFPSLENIILGTESMPSERLKEAIDYFGPKIRIGYGMVEALPPVSLLTPVNYIREGVVREGILGSVGRILKGVKVRIIDANFNELTTGNIGKICINSQSVGQCYVGSPAESENVFRNGWFYSKDYGFIDEGGFLYVMGRESDMVLDTERLVFAREIEDKLYKLLFIKQCVVLKKENRIVAFISLREKINFQKAAAEIRTFCQDCIEESLRPKDIHIKKKIPLTCLGKVDKVKLLKEA